MRLCQISGLQEVFSSDSFSQAWTAKLTDQELLDCLDESDIESEDDESSTRIFHEWKDWECFPAGFYKDGYTQPIVPMADQDNTFEVIDGFHRNRCGKEYPEINTRVHGYLPLVQIRSTQEDKTDRMASTIRHNRARGKHRVESMTVS